MPRLTQKENAAERTLFLLREFQKIDSEFPIQYGVCLLEISLNEGLSLTDLSRKTNMALSTVSRIIGALSKHRQKGVPYDLVTVKICPQERRRKEIYLTDKGKNVIARLQKIQKAA